MTERRFSSRRIWVASGLVAIGLIALYATFDTPTSPQKTVIWATSDPHVERDIKEGRESIADPIRQSEGKSGFDWDAMLILGDFAASKGLPDKSIADEVVRQLRSVEKHSINDIYVLAGNHDASWVDDPQPYWFERFLDPSGGHSSPFDASKRPFPVTGNWERYKFEIGNVLFLMLSDFNAAPRPVGWGYRDEGGVFYQAEGAVTRETFEWWKREVLENRDKIIVTAHHHMLRDTTTMSKRGGGEGLHCDPCGPMKGDGAGYLYYMVENPTPENFAFTPDATDFIDFMTDFAKEHNEPAIDMWLGGHSHATEPDQVVDGQGLIEVAHGGVTFINVSGLTFWHGGGVPMSRLIEFTPESSEAIVRTYIHGTKQHRPRGNGNVWDIGFYPETSHSVKLRHPFRK